MRTLFIHVNNSTYLKINRYNVMVDNIANHKNTHRHDIDEILLKVTLNPITLTLKSMPLLNL